MKTIATITTALALFANATIRAEDTGEAAESRALDPFKPVVVKPYPPIACIVPDEKHGETGKPVVFHVGQETKSSCKDFDMNPELFRKKL